MLIDQLSDISINRVRPSLPTLPVERHKKRILQKKKEPTI